MIYVFRTCIAPLERIKLECIVQGSKRSWVNIIRCIWLTEGLRGFWKGNALNLFRMVPFKSINFICYDMYLAYLLSIHGKEGVTNHERLICGGVSGVVATVLCIPLDTVRICCHDIYFIYFCRYGRRLSFVRMIPFYLYVYNLLLPFQVLIGF